MAKVSECLLRATIALNQAGIPYAVAGGNAVAAWVATVDEGAVRNTRDVDLLVRRSDLDAVTKIRCPYGVISRPCFGVAEIWYNLVTDTFAGEPACCCLAMSDDAPAAV